MATNITIPGGRDRGKAPSECDPRSLAYWAEKANDPAVKAACAEELQKREGGGCAPAGAPRPAHADRAALAKAPTISLGAGMGDPATLTAHLEKLSADHHVISPATSIDVLPPGCGVAVNYVLADTGNDSADVYQLSGKLGLSGALLARIGAAAGVDWDASQSGRLDNGHDPHYVHFRAVGHVRNFDGTARTITGEVEIDAREGSPQVEEIRQKAAKRNSDGAPQLLELRKFLLRHAESKAKNRAIACMGVRRSYTRAELQKPFAICRLMWTGESQDPELRRLFAEKTADMFLGGMSQLYGRPAPQPAPAAHSYSPPPRRFEPGTIPQFQGHQPPPISARREAQADDDDDSYLNESPPPAARTQERAPEPDSRPDTSQGEADY